jgi:hypothetical protein
MIVVYCFIGILPDYAIDTVYQTRLFYDGPIYFIVNDVEAPIVQRLKNEFNVILIKYINVININFLNVYNKTNKKFVVVDKLNDRRHLFRYAFERFFVLYKLMIKENLSDVLFLELDNLIYNDPRNWETALQSHDLSYMFDNHDRFASGICFIKNSNALLQLNNSFLNFIENTNKFITEMTALYEFWEANKSTVQILPTHWPVNNLPSTIWSNYDKFNKSIFDAASLGIYHGGLEIIYTNNKVVKGSISKWSLINYSSYKYEWKKDEKNRKIPYIWNNITNEWLRINNLHIHSKDLKPHLSI